MARGMFVCNGTIDINDWQLIPMSFLLQKDLDYLLYEKRIDLESCVPLNIFNCKLTATSLLTKIKHFTCCTEKELKLLSRHGKTSTFGQVASSDFNERIDFSTIRITISGFLFHLRNIFISWKEVDCDLTDIAENAEKDIDELILTINRFLKQLHEIQDSAFHYVASNSNKPENHLLHIHLDLRWLWLGLLQTKYIVLKYSKNNTEKLENSISSVFGDLIHIALKIFMIVEEKDYQFKTPYSCTCVRELWIMLQMLTDQLHANGNGKIFWLYVKFFLCELFSNESTTKINSPHLKLKNCKQQESFAVWLIYHLTLLYGYDKNGNYCYGPSDRFKEVQLKSSIDLAERVLKIFTDERRNIDEKSYVHTELQGVIPLLNELTLKWWKAQIF
ncbi:hypothetical protein TKK_0011674 [Trichogramma kaykai]